MAAFKWSRTGRQLNQKEVCSNRTEEATGRAPERIRQLSRPDSSIGREPSQRHTGLFVYEQLSILWSMMAQSAIISQRQGLADCQACLCNHMRAAAARNCPVHLYIPRIQLFGLTSFLATIQDKKRKKNHLSLNGWIKKMFGLLFFLKAI